MLRQGLANASSAPGYTDNVASPGCSARSRWAASNDCEQGRRMTTPGDDADSLEQEFSRLGIPTNSPGFYDHPSFLEREKSQSDFLELYASFVEKRHYDPDYLEYSRGVIAKSAEILHKELAQDGRLGACIDTSMVLSRILEREGVWNYCAKGSLTLEFPSQNAIPNLYLWPVNKGEFQAAHAWLVAPPFLLVDIAVKYQPYMHDVAKYLPNKVVVEEALQSRASEDDLFSPYARAQFQARGVPQGFLIAKVIPHLPRFWSVFPPRMIDAGNARIKYTPTGISASDRPLEEITSLVLSGRTGIEIYKDLIQPAL